MITIIPDLKIFHNIQVFDLRFQVDNMFPKNIQLFGEYGNAPAHGRFFILLVRHSEIKMVSDENKTTEIIVLENDIQFTVFFKRNILNDNAITRTELKKVFSYPTQPRESKKNSK